MPKLKVCLPILVLAALCLSTHAAFGQIPGLAYETTDNRKFLPLSDQGPGSVLVYNLFSSNLHAPHVEDTRISITNTSPDTPVIVHLMWVNGATCTTAETYISLAANQSKTLLASEKMPSVRGYLIAQAVTTGVGVNNAGRGIPIAHDFLIGDALIRLSGLPSVKLTADAFVVSILPLLLFPNPGTPTTSGFVFFDQVCYTRAPRALNLSSITGPITIDGTTLVINRFGGNLVTGGSALAIGTMAGIVYDQSGTPLSFTLPAAGCQFMTTLSNMVPLTTPNIGTAIGSNQNGWMTLWSAVGNAIVGAAINFDAFHHPGSDSGGHHFVENFRTFNGGANLHIQTFNPGTSLTVPVSPVVF